ncbi:MAG TPA: hypothetical protein VFO65_10335 [Acidimicrobiales bacterium]|nr:hypothetical protein [Acidimicrobiales bacterium]
MSGWHRWRWLAIAVTVAACRGGAAEGPPPLDACGLLGRDEATAALGPVEAPAAGRGAATDDLAGRSGCAWVARDGSAAVLVELVRTADMAPRVRRTGFSAAARFGAARSRHPDAVEVDDLGDDAFWDPDGAVLHVLAGASYLTFEVASDEPGDAEMLARRLAGPAVARVHRADGPD